MTRRICIVLLAALLSACGFQLRGTSNFVFKRLYIASSNAQMKAELTRMVRYGSHSVVVDDPKAADARLEILSIAQNRTAVSLDPLGQASEYELTSVTAFRLVDAQGRELIPRSEIRLTRDLPYNDAQVQAGDAEAALLYRDMVHDTVDHLVRRLEAAKRPNAELTTNDGTF